MQHAQSTHRVGHNTRKPGVSGDFSLIPRLGGGGERAWYAMFVHALNHPNFPGIWILTVHVRDTVTCSIRQIARASTRPGAS